MQKTTIQTTRAMTRKGREMASLKILNLKRTMKMLTITTLSSTSKTVVMMTLATMVEAMAMMEDIIESMIFVLIDAFVIPMMLMQFKTKFIFGK